MNKKVYFAASISLMIRGSQDVKVYDYADVEEAKGCIDCIFEQ